MSTKCQYRPVTSICVSPPPENHRRRTRIGHHADQGDPDDQVEGVQPGHEEVEDEEHLEPFGIEVRRIGPVGASCSGRLEVRGPGSGSRGTPGSTRRP